MRRRASARARLAEPPSSAGAGAAGSAAALPPAGRAARWSASMRLAARTARPAMAASCARWSAAPSDTRLMVVYGYARLVGYDEQAASSCPTSSRRVDVEDGRIFTLHLRKGHRWSDGEPFTTEDFRYYWEDVANNKELSPVRPAAASCSSTASRPSSRCSTTTDGALQLGEAQPVLPAGAGRRRRRCSSIAPAHYLKQFHANVRRPEKLEAAGRRGTGRATGRSCISRKDDMYEFDNPDLPTLQPWMHTTPPPAERFVARAQSLLPPGRQRRPAAALHRPGHPRRRRRQADPGQDRRRRDRPAGARPRFKQLHVPEAEREAQRPVTLRLWQTARGSASRALSRTSTPTTRSGASCCATCASAARCRSAIDRDDDQPGRSISASASGGNNTVLPASPLYQAGVSATPGRDYDPRRGQPLLDEIGLTERDADGLRLLPDGRPMELIVETAGEEHRADRRARAGRATTGARSASRSTRKPSQREVLRNRVFSGETLMSIWFGIENGIPTRRHEPDEFAPTSQRAAAMAEVGPVLRDQGREPASRPTCPRRSSCSSSSTPWNATSTRGARRRSGAHARDLQPTGVHDRPRRRRACSRSRRASAAQPARGGASTTGSPGRSSASTHPDTFWFDKAG